MLSCFLSTYLPAFCWCPQVGDSAAAVLGSLGRAFESLDARAAAAAARGLADAAAALPPKSSERARFGRRLGSFAGPLRSGDCEELKQVRFIRDSVFGSSKLVLLRRVLATVSEGVPDGCAY